MSQPIPRELYKTFFGIFLLIFCWWPLDLLITWEKKTESSFRKDRYLAMLAGTVILFVFPYHWLATPFWETLGIALFGGIILPNLILFVYSRKERRMIIDPHRVHHIAMGSPRAQEFLNSFPAARIYVVGTSVAEGGMARCIFHHREPQRDLGDAFIDFVLEVGVERDLGIYLGGRERLHCYLYQSRGGRGGIGFLPTMNIGRALDYGFSDEEMEHAINESNRPGQEWTPLGSKPVLIQHYPGKVYQIR
ncbi:MAG: hypothetical protein ACOX5R_12870 [bacterium]